jgi:hypothetical protein
MAGGLYLPNAGDVLAAATAIEKWSQQVIIQCTSGTRPASPVSGMMIWQTDTKTHAVYGTAWCETTPISTAVVTTETTASTSFVALATALTVSATTGTKALLRISALVDNTGAGNGSELTYAVSGATTAVAVTQTGIYAQNAAGYLTSAYKNVYLTGWTAGINTITEKAQVSAGTGGYRRRVFELVGVPT